MGLAYRVSEHLIMDTYEAEHWTGEARRELEEKLRLLSDAQCREVIKILLELDDPSFLLAILRGTLSGMAARKKRSKP